MRYSIIALCMLLLSSFHVIYAQQELSDEELLTLSLEDLLNMEVISASKTSEKLTDAPGVIQVITSEEIERFGALNLAEVIDRLTGTFNVSSYTYPQNITSVRGDLTNAFDTHVLLLLNGRPMRESTYGGFNSSIYLAFPLYTIERLEVIRGPGSVLYGSNAYSGVINIITKKAEEAEAEVRVTGGSFGTTDVQGGFNFAKNDLQVTAGFKWYDETGWDFTATDIIGDTRTISYLEKNKSFLVNSKYKNLSLNVMHTNSEQRSFSIVLPLWTVVEPAEDKRFETQRTILDLGYEFEFSDKFRSNVNVTYNDFGLLVWLGSDLLTDRNDGSQDVLFEVSNYYNPSDKLNVLFGGTAYLQSGEVINNIASYSNTWYSFYSQVDYKVIDQLKLVAGGQFNSIEGLDNDFVPRFGAIYNATDELGAKVLWGQSFRAPYAFESGIFTPGIQVGNTDLEAEKLSNLDLQVFYQGNKFEIYATYFRYTSANLIAQAPLDSTGVDPAVTFVNLQPGVGQIEEDPNGSGFSLETKFIPNKNVYITGSYSYQTNEAQLFGSNAVENFTYVPTSMIKLGVSYQTNDGALSIGLFNSYLSDFSSDITDVLPAIPANGQPESFNLLSSNVNLNLTTLFKSNLKQDILLGFYGTNILDEEISFPDFTTRQLDSFPGRPGAAFYGSLAVKF